MTIVQIVIDTIAYDINIYISTIFSVTFRNSIGYIEVILTIFIDS